MSWQLMQKLERWAAVRVGQSARTAPVGLPGLITTMAFTVTPRALAAASDSSSISKRSDLGG